MQKRISRTAKRAIRPVSSSRIAGFTIIELMISLLLLAVAAALSLPSYRDMIEKRQLTHGAEQIMAFVNSAQLEATRRNDFVTISWKHTADNEWCFGTTLGEDACNCKETLPAKTDYCTIDSKDVCDPSEADPTVSAYCQPSVISNLNVGSRDMLKAITGDGDYTFDPVRGIFDESFNERLIVDLSSDSESYNLNLVMNKAGDTVICSIDDAHKVPGYGPCPADDDDEEEL